MSGPELVHVDAVRQAREVVAGVVRATPTEEVEAVSALCGRTVLVKPEQRQRTGSFKIRGAVNHIHGLVAQGRSPATTQLVAASAGNHAQGVALAARLAEFPARIYMPLAAPLPKVEATRAYGAEVHLVGHSVDEALVAAQEDAASTGAHLVPPFDDPLVIAGQGTIGLEILDEAPQAGVVVVPVGGGGLISGIAVAVKAIRPDVRVVGVQAEGAAGAVASLAAGHPVSLDSVRTIADGIALKAPSALTLAHLAALVDEVITVSDEEIARTLVLLLERAKVVVEPAGAVGLAAVLGGHIPGSDPVVAVLSGGNVDPLVLMKLIEHGLSASGRFLRLRVVLADRPGALADLARSLADQDLNVLGVEHHRAGVGLGIDEVEVAVTLETRDPAHRLLVIDRLRAEGFVVDLADRR